MTDYIKIRFTRGDSGAVITKPFKLKGDHRERKLRFRVLDGKEETANVIFSRSSTNNGGEDGELLVEYDSTADITEVTPVAVPENTQGREADTYYFSLTSTAVDDETDVQTTHKGDFILEWDGESPFNNLPGIDDYEKVVLIDTKDFNNNTLLIFKTGEGFVPLTLAALETLLQNSNYSIFAPEFDPYNPDAVTPNVDGLTRRVEEVNNNILLELDEEQNLTIKEM